MPTRAVRPVRRLSLQGGAPNPCLTAGRGRAKYSFPLTPFLPRYLPAPSPRNRFTTNQYTAARQNDGRTDLHAGLSCSLAARPRKPTLADDKVSPPCAPLHRFTRIHGGVSHTAGTPSLAAGRDIQLLSPQGGARLPLICCSNYSRISTGGQGVVFQ